MHPRQPEAVDNDNDDTTILHNINYGFEYDFINRQLGQQTTKPTRQDGADSETKAQETYEFRLFSNSSRSSKQTAAGVLPRIHRSSSGDESESKDTTTDHHDTQHADPGKLTISVRLSPTPPLGQTWPAATDEGAFLPPRHRPESCYFTAALPPSTQQALKSQYASSALSGQAILLKSLTTQWPGAHVPWRVIHIPLSSSSSVRNSRPNPTVPSTSKSKSKPSKKRRIILRRRSATAASATLQDREKRRQRNREKKIKRREREKRKKLAQAADSQSQQTEGKAESETEGDLSL